MDAVDLSKPVDWNCPRYALIVGAGSALQNLDRLRKLVEGADLVVCADGGFEALEAVDCLPDVFLGDLDSTRIVSENPHLIQEYKEFGRLFTFPVRKDKTDMELAFDLLQEHGVRQGKVIGALGTRLDHSLCNIFFLPVYLQRGVQLSLVTDTGEIRYLGPGSYRLPETDAASYTSFLANPLPVTLSLKGFDYELSHRMLVPGSSLCVSNHVLTAENCLEIEGVPGSGCYYIVSSDKEPSF